MTGLAIGKLAVIASTKVQTIRYYEEIGLIRPFTRTEGGHRLYGPEDVRRLKFIRHARELGFEIPAIRDLIGLADTPTASCADADSIARQHLHEIDSKLERLQALRVEIQGMVDACSSGRVATCGVIGALSEKSIDSGRAVVSADERCGPRTDLPLASKPVEAACGKVVRR